MNIGSPSLSDMLNGKRPITNQMKQRLGLALGLSIGEIETYMTAAKSHQVVPTADEKVRQIALDQFSLISEWYHYAILELLKVRDFKPNTAWIARALGLTKGEANIAIERLMRLGLIENDPERGWVETTGGYSTNISPGLTSAGAKKLQKQILEQSLKALEEIPLAKRNHTSMTLAIDPAALPEAVKRIARFRRELADFLEQSGTAREVYQISVSIFPVTQVSAESGAKS